MQLPAAGFYALIILPAPQKPVGGLSARLGGKCRLSKTSRLAPAERLGAPPPAGGSWFLHFSMIS